jgi:hypothetical protein
MIWREAFWFQAAADALFETSDAKTAAMAQNDPAALADRPSLFLRNT